MTEDTKGAFSFPPGHFYSPIPAIEEIRRREEHIFDQWPHEIPGIDLNTHKQLDLLDEFRKYYGEFPFGFSKKDGLRFYLGNPSYSHSDAVILYCMLRHLKPKRIIEIGSGFSSCIILDTVELFLDNAVSCTFIEPYPQLLMSLIHEKDRQRLEIIPRRLQDADASVFSELSDSDILFIDSTHVSKTDSDVNHIFFRILPYLNRGVHIHFHDIFYPFEYPKDWIYQGLAWNEAYILRAFLEFNPAFRIQFFNTYLAFFFTEEFFKGLPFPLKYVGGSIWLQKIT
jgi:hypothetical protein